MKTAGLFRPLLSAFCTASASGAVLGAPSSLLARLRVENTAVSKGFTFPTPTADLIPVQALVRR